jgi:hypothetical protein
MTRDMSWLSVLATILLVRWLALEAFTESAIKKGEELVYRPPFGIRFLFGTATPGFIYAAGAVLLSKGQRENWWLSGMFLGFALLIVCVWPADIGLSKSHIYARKWLGVWKRAFRWEDVDYATVDPSDDSVDVVSKGGLRIKHTRYHVDRRGFIREVTNRCKVFRPGPLAS